MQTENNNNHVQKASNPFAAKTSEIRPHNVNALAMSDQARAVAEVQSALMIARTNPRDQIAAVDRILNACARPSLAEVAVYQYSRGGSDISGPSIRLAEAIAQQWGNIQFGFNELARGIDYDGVTYSEIGAYAWDLESNTRRPLQFRVRHWRDTRSGGYPLKDERDIYELIANQAQRRVRACILAVIPGDVVEAAVNQCEITLKSKADTSPEAMQKMIDSFGQFGITKAQIEKRIQRRMDAIQPAQVVSLKKVYASLRDGMSVPIDWFELDEVKTEKEGDQAETGSRSDKLKESLKARTNGQNKEPAPEPEKKPEQAKKPETAPSKQQEFRTEPATMSDDLLSEDEPAAANNRPA